MWKISKYYVAGYRLLLEKLSLKWWNVTDISDTAPRSSGWILLNGIFST